MSRSLSCARLPTSAFAVTTISKFGNYIFMKSSLNISPFINDTGANIIIVPPKTQGLTRIITQSQYMLDSLRNIATKTENEYIINKQVTLFNDCKIDLGSISGSIINESKMKTMLRSIELDLADPLGQPIINVILIDDYELLNKSTNPETIKNLVCSDFQDFIIRYSESNITIIFKKEIYNILAGYDLFKEPVSGFTFHSCESEKLADFALEYTHGKRIIENESEYPIKVSLSNAQPLFAKTIDINPKVDIKCRTTQLDTTTKRLDQFDMFSVFQVQDTTTSLVNLVLKDDITLAEICDIGLETIENEENISLQHFTKAYYMRNLLLELNKKYLAVSLDFSEITKEINSFLLLNLEELKRFKLLLNTHYLQDKFITEDNKLLFQENKQLLLDICSTCYILSGYVKRQTLAIISAEYKKQTESIEVSHRSIFEEFNDQSIKKLVYERHNERQYCSSVNPPSAPLAMSRQFSA